MRSGERVEDYGDRYEVVINDRVWGAARGKINTYVSHSADRLDPQSSVLVLRWLGTSSPNLNTAYLSLGWSSFRRLTG